MADKIEKLPAINTDRAAHGAQLFAELEQYSNDDQEGFRFFVQKYKPLFYEDFDWGAHMFPPEQLEAGILMKWLPMIISGVGLIVSIFILFRLK